MLRLIGYSLCVSTIFVGGQLGWFLLSIGAGILLFKWIKGEVKND
jgi:hypothetical protein